MAQERGLTPRSDLGLWHTCGREPGEAVLTLIPGERVSDSKGSGSGA